MNDPDAANSVWQHLSKHLQAHGSLWVIMRGREAAVLKFLQAPLSSAQLMECLRIVFRLPLANRTQLLSLADQAAVKTLESYKLQS